MITHCDQCKKPVGKKSGATGFLSFPKLWPQVVYIRICAACARPLKAKLVNLGRPA
jgi:hypothetical protein